DRLQRNVRNCRTPRVTAMYPDFPEIKKKLVRLARERMRQQRRERLGVFAEASVTIIHEGDTEQLERDDGVTETVRIASFTAERTVPAPRNLKDWTPADTVAALDDLTRQIADQQGRMFVDTMNQAVTEAGNVIKRTEGMPMAEEILKMLEKILVSFDEHGR